MIKTFVLIIVLKWGSGTAVTNVPGYPSLEACEQAAAESRKGADIYWNGSIEYCIPGPEAKP